MIVEIEGVEKFRKSLLIASAVFSLITILVLISD